ncbi:arylamine n-acetyltransferase [Fusarium phyllophilum]|uniref:Arylamine n-acetyltransferase n=1 Tax=Fusarium phyllophilum TaxID=47803 RepID=A0A8H5IGQ2_9HYPO|nr:arylamine n-acetyltransferase [Fusarium phyllophilum]
MGIQNARFIHDFTPGQVSQAPEHKMWQYQCRNSSSQPWETFYSFSDMVEWLPPDFAVVNYFTAMSSKSAAVTSICVVKFMRRPTANSTNDHGNDSQDQEVYGKRILLNESIKENLGGKTKVIHKCRDEEERVEALETWFGIRLTEEEALSIKGYATELK